jgi:hypothetical protein
MAMDPGAGPFSLNRLVAMIRSARPVCLQSNVFNQASSVTQASDLGEGGSGSTPWRSPQYVLHAVHLIHRT